MKQQKYYRHTISFLISWVSEEISHDCNLRPTDSEYVLGFIFDSS